MIEEVTWHWSLTPALTWTHIFAHIYVLPQYTQSSSFTLMTTNVCQVSITAWQDVYEEIKSHLTINIHDLLIKKKNLYGFDPIQALVRLVRNIYTFQWFYDAKSRWIWNGLWRIWNDNGGTVNISLTDCHHAQRRKPFSTLRMCSPHFWKNCANI